MQTLLAAIAVAIARCWPLAGVAAKAAAKFDEPDCTVALNHHFFAEPIVGCCRKSLVGRVGRADESR